VNDHQRALLRLATRKDESLSVELLAGARIVALACNGMQQLVDELRSGAGVLLLAEETLVGSALQQLATALDPQPAWSDLPVIVLAGQGANSPTLLEALQQLRNATVIERPVRIPALLSAVQSALRARSRQLEVRALLEDLRTADRRKTEFLATLAHELRNPLAPISSALALLQRGPDPQTAQGYQAMMRRQVDHMVRLVDDLMEVSRITQGKLQLHCVPLPLQPVVTDAIEFSRPLLDRAGHVLTVRMDATPLPVSVDAVRITQVVSNLLNNAAKYTPRGGRVAVRVWRDGDAARIAVSDNGMGLTAALLERIFDMFVQGSGAGGATQGGLGIGLTLVKALVELHGGGVAATSAGVGQGSTFTVTLPVVATPAGMPSGSCADEALEAAALSCAVLVVDDNRDAADSLTALLRALGARASVCYNARDALRAATEARFDVAILDLGMPEVDGYQLARDLRRLPAGQAIRLIALSGWGQDADRERAARAGFDAHLVKPAQVAQLIGLLGGR